MSLGIVTLFLFPPGLCLARIFCAVSFCRCSSEVCANWIESGVVASMLPCAHSMNERSRSILAVVCFTMHVHGCWTHGFAYEAPWVASITDKPGFWVQAHPRRPKKRYPERHRAEREDTKDTSQEVKKLRIWIYVLNRWGIVRWLYQVHGIGYLEVAFAYEFMVPFRETMSSTASPEMPPSPAPKYQNIGITVNQTCAQA